MASRLESKEEYGETDKVSNFFTGDHSRPFERIRKIPRWIDWCYATPPRVPPP